MQPYWNGFQWVTPGYGMQPYGQPPPQQNDTGFDIGAGISAQILLDMDPKMRNQGVIARLNWIGAFLDAFRVSWDADMTTPIDVAVKDFADTVFTN